MNGEPVLYSRLSNQVSALVAPVGPIDVDIGRDVVVIYRRANTEYERDIQGTALVVKQDYEIVIAAFNQADIWDVRDEVFAALDNYEYPTLPGSGSGINLGQYRFQCENEFQDAQNDLDRFTHSMIFVCYWTNYD